MGCLRENDLLKGLSLYVSVENSPEGYVSKLPIVAAFGKGLGLGGLVQNISECKNQDVSMHWVNIIGEKNDNLRAGLWKWAFLLN